MKRLFDFSVSAILTVLLSPVLIWVALLVWGKLGTPIFFRQIRPGLQGRRHEVLPGITGWAQVNGRNAISWEEKFRLDVWYVDHHAFFLDIKILLLTLVQVFKRHGIQETGHVTAREFMGTASKADENNHE